MIRLIAAALCLTVAISPAFACEYLKSAGSDTQKRTVASQPAKDQATPPQSAAQARKPS